MCVFVHRARDTNTYINTHLQLTLCREQSIRGYVSKKVRFKSCLSYLHNHEYFALDRVLVEGVC